MNLKLRLAVAKQQLILAAQEVPMPVDPDVGAKFGAALTAMNELIAVVNPVLNCPHNPLTCRGCIENACFN